MTLNSVLNSLMPFIVWAGKFAYISAVTFWAGALWFFAYIIRAYSSGDSSQSGSLLALLLKRSRRFFRGFGLAASILSILLILEVYRQSNLSLSYFSFTVDAAVTIASYVIISEILLVPALSRYEYLSTYVHEKNIGEKPVHAAALTSTVRRFCLYQIIPVLFVVMTVAAQFSIY